MTFFGLPGDKRHRRRQSGRMKRRPKPPFQKRVLTTLAADATATLQVKVWLTGISPVVWRRILVPAAMYVTGTIR